MTQHARRQIRDAAKAALASLPLTAGRVFTNRPEPLSASERPGLVVMTPVEGRNDDLSSFGRAVISGRTVTLAVIGYAEGEAIDDELDAIALEVEQVLDGATLGGLAKDINLIRTVIETDGEGRKRSGEITMEFAADYRTARGAPDTALD